MASIMSMRPRFFKRPFAMRGMQSMHRPGTTMTGTRRNLDTPLVLFWASRNSSWLHLALPWATTTNCPGPAAAASATAPGPVASPAPHTVPVQMVGAPMVSINVPAATPMTVPATPVAAPTTTPMAEAGGPWHVLSVQDYSTGAWTTGWWHERGSGLWKWHQPA